MKPLSGGRASSVAIVVGLAGLVGLVFGSTVRFDFVGLDDRDYVVENPHVLGGLTAENVAWAFTTTEQSNWHPVTWLSLMLDAELGGGPGGYHLTNIVLHLVNTLLLFLVLDRATSARWRSALVAALFAVHPLHVESVAWIAERKDVLSTSFMFLTLVTPHARNNGKCQSLAATESTVISRAMLPIEWTCMSHRPGIR